MSMMRSTALAGSGAGRLDGLPLDAADAAIATPIPSTSAKTPAVIAEAPAAPT